MILSVASAPESYSSAVPSSVGAVYGAAAPVSAKLKFGTTGSLVGIEIVPLSVPRAVHLTVKTRSSSGASDVGNDPTSAASVGREIEDASNVSVSEPRFRIVKRRKTVSPRRGS